MKNLNADFLLDIWAELKAKRLAPVAIGLVVLAVAMPAVMLKGEEAPADAPLPIAAPSASDAAEVEVAEELADRGSKLESYKARDPFDGLVKPDDDTAGGSGTAIAPSDQAAGDDEKPDSAPPSGGSTGGSDGSAPEPDEEPSGTGSPGGGTSDPPKVVKRPRAGFTYQLDVKFGRPGREKRYPSLARMSFLPSAKLPALLFMGVPDNAKSALFLVHPGLNHQGQGECIPSRRRCEFLELGIGREHYVSANDREFRIRLLGIKRVKLSVAKKQSETARRAARRDRSARTVDGKAGEVSAEYEYDWPWLVDGVR